MLPQEIIRLKRDNKKLSQTQIKEFISGMLKHEVDDTQVAALTMAIYFNGMSRDETVALTLAMRDSGDVLSWSGYDKPIVDKHSSGGVGDKISLILAPILAACDVYVPMIAGRGLGHTGGTIDKLESIPGYNTQANNDLFRHTVKSVGCAIIGQTGNLAPADKKIYAIRDVCSTVESIPLITASILSKKLAAGLQYLVMDLKCGNGAFMQNFSEAKELAQSIVSVANNAGTKTAALITDMNQVLGQTVGNALEVKEAMQYLRLEQVDKRLDYLCKALAVKLLQMCGRCSTENQAQILVEKALSSGDALEKFAAMAANLGGPHDLVEKSEKYLPHAAHSKPIFAGQEGYVQAMDTRRIGLALVEMGGGRTIPGQTLDLAVGFGNFCQIGDYVDTSTPLAVVHYQTEKQYIAAQKILLSAIKLGETPVKIENPLLGLVQ